MCDVLDNSHLTSRRNWNVTDEPKDIAEDIYLDRFSVDRGVLQCRHPKRGLFRKWTAWEDVSTRTLGPTQVIRVPATSQLRLLLH